MSATTDMTSAPELLQPQEEQQQIASRSAFQLFRARLREDKVALFGGIVIRRRPQSRNRARSAGVGTMQASRWPNQRYRLRATRL